MKEWKLVIDIIRKSEGRGGTLSKTEKESIDNIAKSLAEHQLKSTTIEAEDVIGKLETEMKSLQEQLNEETKKRISLEESKKELLELVDRKFDSEEGSTGLLSELFEAKKSAEEKLEDTKKKLKQEAKIKSDTEEQVKFTTKYPLLTLEFSIANFNFDLKK